MVVWVVASTTRRINSDISTCYLFLAVRQVAIDVTTTALLLDTFIYKHISVLESCLTVNFLISTLLCFGRWPKKRAKYLRIYLNIHQLEALNFTMIFYFKPLHVSSTCAHRQEVKIVLYSLWYHHSYRWPSRARDGHL